jgi:hypothetical protein
VSFQRSIIFGLRAEELRERQPAVRNATRRTDTKFRRHHLVAAGIRDPRIQSTPVGRMGRRERPGGVLSSMSMTPREYGASGNWNTTRCAWPQKQKSRPDLIVVGPCFSAYSV